MVNDSPPASEEKKQEVRGEQKTESVLLTGEQVGERIGEQTTRSQIGEHADGAQIGEQSVDLRPGAGQRDHSGFRLISGNSAGDVGAHPAHSWPVVSNLALVPTLTGEQEQPLTGEQPKLLTSEQKQPLTGEQGKAGAGEQGSTPQGERSQSNRALTSEQADWLKNLLPKLAEGATGWWDVEARGKGFGVKFRWRASGQHTLTFSRVSRAAFQKLAKLQGQTVQIGGKVYDKAEWYLRDWIGGQLADLRDGRDEERRDKAGQVAPRLGFEPRGD